MQVLESEYLRISDLLTDLASQLSLYKLIGNKDYFSWNLIFLDGDVVLLELDIEHQHLVFSTIVGESAKFSDEIQILALKFNSLWRENNNVFLGIEEPNRLVMYSRLNSTNSCAMDVLNQLSSFRKVFEYWQQIIKQFSC